jgi:hypothetical protein
LFVNINTICTQQKREKEKTHWNMIVRFKREVV